MALLLNMMHSRLRTDCWAVAFWIATFLLPRGYLLGMKRVFIWILGWLLLLAWFLAFEPNPASFPEKDPRVKIDHVSFSRMSDGSLSVYCIIQNVDTVPMSDINIRVYILDSIGDVMRSRDLVFFSTDSLRPDQKALFTESFPECWDCRSVKVVQY